MKFISKAMLGALMLASAGLLTTAPARAAEDTGVSFGSDNTAGMNSCDYYDYYDEAPPWGLPEDYCSYPVSQEPVFVDGSWYRGPIYYRLTHGRRMFWLNGGWKENAAHGPVPPQINWVHRGSPRSMPNEPRNGFRPGIGFHGGSGHDWRSVDRSHNGNANRPGIAIRAGGSQWGGGTRLGGSASTKLGGNFGGMGGLRGGGQFGEGERPMNHAGGFGGGFQGGFAGGGGLQGGGVSTGGQAGAVGGSHH